MGKVEKVCICESKDRINESRLCGGNVTQNFISRSKIYLIKSDDFTAEDGWKSERVGMKENNILME